ncbi:FtsK/SpoIIIE family DNA translocase [Parvularcula sp. LCG005]|uniref:FtsK/SpoIIIE family DNA translocase n=1 Tax=Parvularcula sp. LCG005 TaxID=3078805 RepID=UPI0029425614|nr:DNA translocase FtsK 4TM domain-containing protein [Parvularcula sp. LCG005]WOI53391.1 DNA translocase FtsK 4TM domain-containing protein [Parvularcula sp. LCG005]
MSRTRTEPDISPIERAAAGVRFVLVRAGAASLVLLGLFLLLSIATHSVSDPSLSTATGRTAISNWGGGAGAVLSDLLLQSLGGASLLLPIVPMMWGWSNFRWGPPDETSLTAWLKGAAWLGGVLAMAGFAAELPRAAAWPFVVDMGGLLGGAVAGLVETPFRLLGLPFPNVFAAVVLLPLAFVLTGRAAGISRDHVEAGLDAFFWCYDWAADVVTEKYRALTKSRKAKPARVEPKLTTPKLAPPKAQPEEDATADAFAPAAAEDDWDTSEYVDDDGVIHDLDEDEEATAPRKIIREVRKVQMRRPISDDQPMFDSENYVFPPLSLLKAPKVNDTQDISDEELEERARMLETVLADFKVNGEIINVRPGPVVTLYELEPAAGVKSSRVIGLADDIARSMSAIACRVAVVPGRNAIGIELPNDNREFVLFQEMLATEDFAGAKGLTLALGKDIGGEPQFADLAKMPHLLIAGTTGSGKSVGINTMILSLLFRLPPDKCKLIMVDPKMLELSVYEGIPHLLSPVVTDPRKAVVALKWTVREMEERYRMMSKIGVRNIHGFNERVEDANERGEELTRKVHSGYDSETGDPIYEEEVLDYEAMPYIVVVIDEVADLMMVAGKDIEAMVQRLAQMARAAGIHLIMATQRPSVDVITGTIKANFPTRISFQVTSKIDSRTILGEQGAEQLLGMGDMLYMAGGGRITRVHGAFVSDDEVEKIVAHLKKQGKPDYIQEVTEGGDDEDGGAAAMLGLDVGGNTSSGDALYDQAVAIVARDRKASTSYIQRRLQIGYNRAATIIERLEEDGVISPANHAGKRDILIGEDAA